MPNKVPGEIAQGLVAASQATHRMTPQDLVVWRTFETMLVPRYAFIRYDIRLGDGRLAPGHHSDTEKRMWTALTQYRADVAIFTDDKVWIIEIKPMITPAMFGQLLAYEDALHSSPFNHPTVEVVGMAGSGHAHVESLILASGIKVCTLDDPYTLKIIFGDLVRLPMGL